MDRSMLLDEIEEATSAVRAWFPEIDQIDIRGHVGSLEMLRCIGNDVAIAILLGDEEVRLFDARTLQERGRAHFDCVCHISLIGASALISESMSADFSTVGQLHALGLDGPPRPLLAPGRGHQSWGVLRCFPGRDRRATLVLDQKDETDPNHYFGPITIPESGTIHLDEKSLTPFPACIDLGVFGRPVIQTLETLWHYTKQRGSRPPS
jgi:hypothetical protein